MADLQKAFQKQGSDVSPFADIITTNRVCISSGVEMSIMRTVGMETVNVMQKKSTMSL